MSRAGNPEADSGQKHHSQCVEPWDGFNPSWELIVADDGSTDETSGYLASVRDAAPVPVTVIADATSRVLPAAINQGLGAARGEYLVVLNSDVVVTDGWLEQLIALANAKGDFTSDRAETETEGEWEGRPAVELGAGSGDVLRPLTTDDDLLGEMLEGQRKRACSAAVVGPRKRT